MAVPDEAEAGAVAGFGGTIYLLGSPSSPRSCDAGFVQDWISRVRSSDRLSNGSVVKLQTQLNQVQATDPPGRRTFLVTRCLDSAGTCLTASTAC